MHFYEYKVFDKLSQHTRTLEFTLNVLDIIIILIKFY